MLHIRRLGLLVVVFALAMTVCSAGSAAGAEVFSVVRLTANAFYDGDCYVDGTRVVWEGEGGADGGADNEVFTWTPATGVVQLTEDQEDSWLPRCDGDRVTWVASGGSDGGTDMEIFTWTPTGGTVQVTENDVEEDSAYACGNRVAYNGKGGSDAGTDWELFVWTSGVGTTQLTVDDANVSFYSFEGDRLGWSVSGGSDLGSDTEVFSWTPGGGIVQHTVNNVDDSAPSVNATRVSWAGKGGSDGGTDWETWTWTQAGGIVQLTENDYHDLSPMTSGDRLAWQAFGGSDGVGDYEVFTWTPGTGVVEVTTDTWNAYNVRVSGDRVTFHTSAPATPSMIRMWTPTGGIQELSRRGEPAEAYAEVSGNRVVWCNPTSDDAEVYLATFGPVPVERLAERTRYSTAVDIARAGFDPLDDKTWVGVTDIVLASGEDRAAADPLAASGLCWAYDAPLFLTQSTGVPSEVKAAVKEIANANGNITVHIVGGPASVPDARFSELSAYVGAGKLTKDRLRDSGNRYDMAYTIAQRMKTANGGVAPDVVLVANGADATKFFDALALSPISAAQGYPILLVKANEIPSATQSIINSFAPSRVIVGGGPNTVSDGVKNALGAERWYDGNRYTTALRIVGGAIDEEWLFADTVGIAAKLPDALTGGSVVGRMGGVLLVTNGTSLTGEVGTWLTTHKTAVHSCYVFGGPNSLTATVKAAIAGKLQ